MPSVLHLFQVCFRYPKKCPSQLNKPYKFRGKRNQFILCLNEDDTHVDMLIDLVTEQVSSWHEFTKSRLVSAV
ncbi:hypothetical protein [Shewanella aestuarii]|uniref:Uncharacterized protein n=1 Tax=Shewanella aestuarii TaxID=1028752 RepID=A0A6G9QL71_9GAMM|nr:hypothetical protein [Shewanella aestuarii]QIR14873.1 hypothetical protein HBH39_10585 [Shewanella aestuarii]